MSGTSSPLLLPVASSGCSFGYGLIDPARLPAAVCEAGFSGAILSDSGGVYGQWVFSRESTRTGTVGGAGAALGIDGCRPIRFVAPDEPAWAALCELVTALRLPGRGGDWRRVFEESSELLVAICPDVGTALALRGRLGFGGRVMVEVRPRRFGPGDPAAVEGEVLRQGLEPLASWPVVFEREADHVLHLRLVAGSRGLPVSALRPEWPASQSAFLPTVARFRQELASAPRSLSNNRELLEMLRTVPSRRRLWPPGDASVDAARLERITRQRLRTSYGDSVPASRRLEEELRQLERGGLCGYFLLFFDTIEFCRERGIAAVARGSAAGSLVSHLLGISAVCPIRYDLSFERFYNRLRREPPDIDLDIESERREEVVSDVLERLGRSGAAVCELVRLRSRGAFRIMAASAGLGRRETDDLASILSTARGDPVWQDARLARLLERSRPLTGLPAHVAPHPCGIAVHSGPVERSIGLEGCNMGIPLAQFDKDGIEWMGMLKMDLLGQRGLSSLSMACRLTGRDPIGVLISTGKLSGRVASLLAEGSTIGTPHVESPAMRDLLRQTRARTVDDVARALAVVRPGAASSGGRRRFFSGEGLGGGIDHHFPGLRQRLADNRGMLLYQEDVSLVAATVLGLEGARADLLRRRIRKGEMSREDLLDVCLARSLDEEAAEALWSLLSGYAGYGFCKAHAVTCAAVACTALSLRVLSPAEYMAAVIGSGGGFYAPFVYIEEARRMGLRLRAPGVNSGAWRARPREDGVMIGFQRLRGMGRKDFEKLDAGRPYQSIGSALRCGIGPALSTSLAAAGCFDELGYTPPEALLMIERGVDDSPDLLSGLPEPCPGLPGYTPLRRARLEAGLLGACVSDSPLRFCPRPSRSTPMAALPARGNVCCWGMPCARRGLEDGSGFVMLMDDTGVVDAHLEPGAYRTARVLSRRTGYTLVLRGRMMRRGRMDASAVAEGPLTPGPLLL